jgi:NADPH:quinone reductase-like Zn-dependent oxidoreductase
MKSCWIVSDHTKATLEYRDVPIPEPKAGEVILETHASSLNRGELMVGGVVHGGPLKLGGNDGAGVVFKVGPGVTDFKVGDKVFGRISGGWAEYTPARAEQLIPMSDKLTWEEAASVGVAFLTAYELIYPPYGKLKKGETLLVAGASSGVGVAAVQIGKALGATVIGTSGSADKLGKLSAAGMDHGIHTRKGDFAATVKELTGGKGVDLAINLVGGSVFPELVRSLARKGRIGIVGYVDGVLKAELDLNALHANRFEVYGISNSKATPEEKAEAMRGFIRDVAPLLRDGTIKPMVDKVFAFNQLPEAKSYVESNAMVGKVVVKIR